MNEYGEKPYWAAQRDYPPRDSRSGSRLKLHIHKPEEYHYLYVLEGGDRICVGNDTFEMTPGVMYLTAPGIRHGFCSGTEKKLVTVELKFTLTDPVLQKRAAELPPMVKDPSGQLVQLLERILQEAENTGLYRRELMELRLRELLYLLLRLSNGEKTSEKTSAEVAMSPVLLYIRDNLHRNISLEDLAAAAHLEKAYFSRKFKEISGCTPMEYLRCTRLAKARELLRYSDMTVTQIAESLGFQSLRHFSRTFHQHIGCSPMDYKTGNTPEEKKPETNSALINEDCCQR